MGLSELWSTSREQLIDKRVHQIIAFAGDGQLTDGGTAAHEFRQFLALIPSDFLERYADECLRESFVGSGFALQDIVNQIGRRLGYSVTDGRYRGTVAHIGFDGLWKFPDGHVVIVEVKTTDTYRVDLQRIANYRRELITVGHMEEEHSSVLIVVGRQDTGDLEAQIRGSRHAWDVRLISIKALLHLMFLKERLDDPATIRRIGDILIPREFTRLDEIVDIVFKAAEETTDEEAEAVAIVNLEENERTAPVAFHSACIARVEEQFNHKLIRQTRSGYKSPDGSFAVVCVVSKTHDMAGHPSFWFGFHPYQKDFLAGAPESVLVLGCGSPEVVLAFPFRDFPPWLADMWTTSQGEKFYWHIRIHEEGGRFRLDRKSGVGRIDVTNYALRSRAEPSSPTPA
jgi:hypothetical protein